MSVPLPISEAWLRAWAQATRRGAPGQPCDTCRWMRGQLCSHPGSLVAPLAENEDGVHHYAGSMRAFWEHAWIAAPCTPVARFWEPRA